MKLFKSFAMLFLAGLTFAACSESNEVAVDTPLTDESTGNYLAFQLYLPTTSGSATRANDVFDNPTTITNEYEVNTDDSYVVLFQGNSGEDNAEFCGAYKLDVGTFSVNSSTQCATEGIVTASVDGTKITTSNKLYAYVILNANGTISNPQPTQVTVSVNGTATTFGTSEKNFSTFKKYLFAAITINKNEGGTLKYFLMTNTPISATKGGTEAATGDISLLPEIKNILYKTAEEAQANPAGEVYVERAAVKVTLAKSTSPAFGTKLLNASTISVDIAGWALGNTNKTYYNNRQYEKSWGSYLSDGTGVSSDRKYRFVSKDEIHTDHYRTYWAQDPNYKDEDFASGWAPTDSYDNIAPTTVENTLSDNLNTYPYYTTENTFDVKHQVQKHTTLAVIKAKIGDGKDFFTASLRDRNKIYNSGSDDKEKVQNLIDTELKLIDTKYASWATTSGNALNVASVEFTNGVLSNITFGSNATDKPDDSNYEKTASDTDFKAYIIRVLGINKYSGGMAYYNIRIRHFDDDETPWSGTGRNVNDVDHIYGYESGGSWSLTEQSTKNFLGRYGVVRNNWYQIEVDGVRSIGEPVPPTPGDTPDDEIENYISLKIHVLPWAIRKQHHTL